MTRSTGVGRGRHHRGRVELALDQALQTRSDLGLAERAALRAQARAVDIGESMSDPHAITEANRAYLELRAAAGLTAAGAVKTDDPFDALLRSLAQPAAGPSDP